MKIELPEKISRPFIYACMGFGANEPDPISVALVAECEELLLSVAEPRVVYREFNIEEIELLVEGEDLLRHLEGCDKCVLMALTLGPAVDKLIRRFEITDMAKAVALDACASSLVEDLCDDLSGRLEAEYGGYALATTSRFSPGYGDLPLSFQKVFQTLLDMHRAIGLSHSKEYLLTPRKSVTAVIGVYEQSRPPKKGRACEICKNFEKCAFRLSGAHCGRE